MSKTKKPVQLVVGDDGENINIMARQIKGRPKSPPVCILPYSTKAGDRSQSRSDAVAMAILIIGALESKETQTSFSRAFNETAKVAHMTALNKGWWKGEDALLAKLEFATSTADRPEFLNSYLLSQDAKNMALFTSEVSEALEALRHGNPPDDKIPEFTGVEAELADVIIRIMDVSQRRGWRIAEAITAKMNFNSTRAVMHGGKKF